MSWTNIKDVRLLPRGTPLLCHTCCNTRGGPILYAESWIVAPDGGCIMAQCQKHGREAVEEYSSKLGEQWTLEPIYHEKGGNVMLPREQSASAAGGGA